MESYEQIKLYLLLPTYPSWILESHYYHISLITCRQASGVDKLEFFTEISTIQYNVPIVLSVTNNYSSSWRITNVWLVEDLHVPIFTNSRATHPDALFILTIYTLTVTGNAYHVKMAHGKSRMQFWHGIQLVTEV